ncbi:MAG: hypothetical protein CFH41_00184 [Alphaproteobacteria bacterium MarineAlpha11_Bin1]|nr:MAG: hypothetical protein CFH41_00184 [Alphaproteobacteria bacterium MarineAlpha11_Bin1]
MKLVLESEKRWRGNQLRHRKGKILLKRLIEGEMGSPENYGLHIGRESAEFFSPRHRHPWDQIRYCISGSVPIGPGKTIEAGEIGYFPEGLHYGPQEGPERTVMVLQFGGASGNGYLNRDEVNRAYEELSEVGSFDKGVFRRSRGKGKRNLDGYEAIWQHLTGAPLVFPRPRYSAPVIMKPGNFAWRAGRESGVYLKNLGRFSDRGMEVTIVRLDRGGHRILQDVEHLRIVFVMKGQGRCGIRNYKRHTAIEFKSGEAASFMPAVTTELLCITIPSVTTMGLSAA